MTLTHPNANFFNPDSSNRVTSNLMTSDLSAPCCVSSDAPFFLTTLNRVELHWLGPDFVYVDSCVASTSVALGWAI